MKYTRMIAQLYDVPDAERSEAERAALRQVRMCVCVCGVGLRALCGCAWHGAQCCLVQIT